MSVRDRWPFSRYEGWVRVEDAPYTEAERRRVRQGAPVTLIGFLVLGLSQDWWLTIFAMLTTSVFTRLYFE